MKYAIIGLGGKQFKITEGSTIKLEHQDDVKPSVLVYNNDADEIFIGEPFLDNVIVEATIVENKLDKKVTVARFKSKSRYRKKKGHRQPVSMVKIDKIYIKGEAISAGKEEHPILEKAPKTIEKPSASAKKTTKAVSAPKSKDTVKKTITPKVKSSSSRVTGKKGIKK